MCWRSGEERRVWRSGRDCLEVEEAGVLELEGDLEEREDREDREEREERRRR